MKKYDVMIVGPVSLDHNIDCEGRERRELSGAGFSFGASKGTSRSGMMPSAWMERPDGV